MLFDPILSRGRLDLLKEDEQLHITYPEDMEDRTVLKLHTWTFTPLEIPQKSYNGTFHSIYYYRLSPALFRIVWQSQFPASIISRQDVISNKGRMKSYILDNFKTGDIQSINDIAGIQYKITDRNIHYQKLEDPFHFGLKKFIRLFGSSLDKKHAIQIIIQGHICYMVFKELLNNGLLLTYETYQYDIENIHHYMNNFNWEGYEILSDIRQIEIDQAIYLDLLDKDGKHVSLLNSSCYL